MQSILDSVLGGGSGSRGRGGQEQADESRSPQQSGWKPTSSESGDGVARVPSPGSHTGRARRSQARGWVPGLVQVVLKWPGQQAVASGDGLCGRAVRSHLGRSGGHMPLTCVRAACSTVATSGGCQCRGGGEMDGGSPGRGESGQSRDCGGREDEARRSGRQEWGAWRRRWPRPRAFQQSGRRGHLAALGVARTQGENGCSAWPGRLGMYTAYRVPGQGRRPESPADEAGQDKGWLAGVKGAESLGVTWPGWKRPCSRSPVPAGLGPGCGQTGAER